MKSIKERIMKAYFKVISISAIIIANSSFVYADTNPTAKINKLGNFFIGIISAVGTVALGWGVAQLALAIKRKDPASVTEAILTIAGGLIMAGVGFVVTFLK